MQLSVYDVASHLVRTLASEVVAPGSHTLFWDGRDTAGRPAHSGTYFLEFIGDVVGQTRKLQLIR